MTKNELQQHQSNLRGYIERNQNEIAKALPNYVPKKRFFKLLVTELVRNPEISKCDPASVIESVYQCARLGLSPGPAPVGKIHLIRFGDKCTTIIDYKGLIDLAKRSGHCKDIRAYVVYEKEVDGGMFRHIASDTPNPPQLYHQPVDFGERGQPVGAYAIAYFDDRDPTWQILSVKDIEKSRAMSRGANSAKSPWKTHWEEMAKKTAIRRLCKFLELSDEISDQLAQEDAAEYKQTTVTPITVASIEDRGRVYSTGADEHSEPEKTASKKRGRPTKKLQQARAWLADSGLTIPDMRNILNDDSVSPEALDVTQIDELRLAVEERAAKQDEGQLI